MCDVQYFVIYYFFSKSVQLEARQQQKEYPWQPRWRRKSFSTDSFYFLQLWRRRRHRRPRWRRHRRCLGPTSARDKRSKLSGNWIYSKYVRKKATILGQDENWKQTATYSTHAIKSLLDVEREWSGGRRDARLLRLLRDGIINCIDVLCASMRRHRRSY